MSGIRALLAHGDHKGRAPGIAQKEPVAGPLTLAFSLPEAVRTGFDPNLHGANERVRVSDPMLSAKLFAQILWYKKAFSQKPCAFGRAQRPPKKIPFAEARAPDVRHQTLLLFLISI